MTSKFSANPAFTVLQRGKKSNSRSVSTTQDSSVIDSFEDVGHRRVVNHALACNGQVAGLASWEEDGLAYPENFEIDAFDRNDLAEAASRNLLQGWEFNASELPQLKAHADNIYVAADLLTNHKFPMHTSPPARAMNQAVDSEMFHSNGPENYSYAANSSRSSFAGSQSGGPSLNIFSQGTPFLGNEEEALVEDEEFLDQPNDEFEDGLMAAGYSGNEDSRRLSALSQMANDISGHYLLGSQGDASERAFEYRWNSTNSIHAGEEDHELPVFLFDTDISYPHSPLTGPTYPGGMNVPPSSHHFQEDLASSWPPTKEAFPPNYLSMLDQSPAPETLVRSQTRPRGVTISGMPAARTGGQSLPQATLPIRSYHKRNSVRKSRSNSLTDNKTPLGSVRVPGRKGGRKGKLPCNQAPVVAQKRQEKVVCIPCRLRRVTCPRSSRDETCTWCSEHEQTCVSASFADISDIETCNFIFQSLCYYPSLDGLRRYRVRYTPFFDLPVLLEALRPYHQRYEARVLSFTGAAWKLNLEICYRLLSQLATGSRSRPLRLHEVVVGRLLPGWVDCIKPTEPDISKFVRFYKYANMPSRNRYSLVPLGDSQPDHHLDIENSEDEKIIRLLVQLCRIVLRSLEIVALRELQQRLNDLNRGRKSIEEVEVLLLEVAQLLGSLRFRLAWWQKVEGGSDSQEFIHRTTELTRILYQWYFEIRKKLPESSLQRLPRGHNATYADAGEVWDDFPVTETADDFEIWMSQAHSTITDLQNTGRLQNIFTPTT